LGLLGVVGFEGVGVGGDGLEEGVLGELGLGEGLGGLFGGFAELGDVGGEVGRVRRRDGDTVRR
jgi:hypothetical protein